MTNEKNPLIETKHAKVLTIRFNDANEKEGVRMMRRKFDEGWKTLEPLNLNRDGYFSIVLYWPKFMEIEPLLCYVADPDKYIRAMKGDIYGDATKSEWAEWARFRAASILRAQ